MSESPSEGGCCSDSDPAVERVRFGIKEQTDSRCRSPPETEGESAQQPETGPPLRLTVARPRPSQGRTRRRSRDSARITPGMGVPSTQGTPVSEPTAVYGTGAGAPGLHGSAKVRTSAGETCYRITPVGREKEEGGRTVRPHRAPAPGPVPPPLPSSRHVTSATRRDADAQGPGAAS